MKRPHEWTYDEGYEADGLAVGDSELYCMFCFHERTSNADGYIPEEDEPECPVARKSAP